MAPQIAPPYLRRNAWLAPRVAAAELDQRLCPGLPAVNSPQHHGYEPYSAGPANRRIVMRHLCGPRVLTEALAAGGDEAKRAFNAMMGMKKIDVAAIKAARRG